MFRVIHCLGKIYPKRVVSKSELFFFAKTMVKQRITLYLTYVKLFCYEINELLKQVSGILVWKTYFN